MRRIEKRTKIFLGECVIIAALLVVIGVLAAPELEENHYVARESVSTEGSLAALLEEQLAEAETEEPIQENGTDAVSENQVSENQVSENEQALSAADDGELNIVVFGDSIWDDKRGEDGVSEYIEGMTGGKVYNCAVGGTSAAIVGDSTDVSENWNSRSLNTMTYVANGTISANSQFRGTEVADILQSVDFSKMDYAIFSYGLNDYFSKVTVFPEDMYDMTTYVGALRHATIKLREAYPDIKILIIAPTYCKVFEGKETAGDSDSYDYGQGTLEKYVEGAKSVADEYGTLFLDAYHDFGINSQSAGQYLADGVHLSADGRKLYGEHVAEFLKADYTK